MCSTKKKKDVKSIDKDPTELILDDDLQNLELLGTVDHGNGVDIHFIEMDDHVFILFNSNEAEEAFFQEVDHINDN